MPTEGQMALFAKTHGLPPGQRAHVVAACVVLHNICETLGDMCQDDWVMQENANATVDERDQGMIIRWGAGHSTPTSRAIRNCRLPIFFVIVAEYLFICIHQLIASSIAVDILML